MGIAKENIQTWRNTLKVLQQTLEKDFYTHKNPARLLKAHAKCMDSLLKAIWLETNIHKACNLIATGGYGRGELFPFSDIDLLILVPEQAAAQQIRHQNEEIEALIGALWDIGLNVGHSVRSLQECIKEAAQDVTVQTNLLEARLLHGNQAEFAQLLAAIVGDLNPTAFLAAKLQEQDNRHAKFNDTAYSLEPNVKESPGGLRDLHSMLWLAQSQYLGKSWAELNNNQVISADEMRQIKKHQRNLQMLRIRLHYLAKRREDRLLFDFQNELADDLGLKNTPRKRASEQLMQNYYYSVRYISLINEIVLKSLSERLHKKQASTAINTHFEARNQLIEAKSADLFKQHPSAILECFLILQQDATLEGFGPTLLRQLQFAKKLVTKPFRDADANKKLFLSILLQPNGVNQSLRRMNRYGILGEYIPVFGKIIGQMQHDLFHVYTVDEHILNVLANLRRFAKPELKHEFPLCTQLFANFEKPHLLYLAALFHDIAKGRGGDHSTLGAVDARKFCNLHDLPKQDTQLVTWLVDAHLQMSKTAQKSDLSDPAVIEHFAHFVKTEIRLTALYLLTVADIRGTSPIVWNAWKARLLESLFLQTRRVLNDPSFTVKQAIVLRQKEATEKLANYGLQKQAYEALWQNVGEAYFTRFDSDEIAWQSRLLTPHTFTDTTIVRARLSPNGDGIQVMIYTRDFDELFARICNFFDRIAYNIGQAKIYTTNHGYALNTFIVLDSSGKSVSYSGLLKHIETELTAQISSAAPLEAPMQGRLSRQVKHMPFATQIKLAAEAHSNYHALDIVTSDRPGLLAQLASIFLQHGIDLRNAKANTLGNRAEDSFLISAKHNKPLSAAQIGALEEELAKL